jgi:recombination associated protein RdgC
MWFKNLQIYRFTQPFELDATTLGQQLQEQAFVPCGSQDTTRSGWVPPLGRHGSEFVHATNGYLMLCAKRQDKLLPAGVINEELEQKALEIEAREARQLPRKERRALRDEVYFSLLPRAFVRSSLQYAYIAPREQLLIVDAASAKRAEDLLQDLRDALGSLSVIPLVSKQQPIEVMTRWLSQGRCESGFDAGEECELRDNANVSSVIRCKNQDLATAEIVNHLKAGMHVSKLALNWQQRLEFVLDEKLVVRRLRFADMVQEQASEIEADDAAAQFDVDFSIMALELSAFLKDLTAAFGGTEPADSPTANAAP